MEKQINQARKAMFIILDKARILNLPFDVNFMKNVLFLFYCMAQKYGVSAIWGMSTFSTAASWDWS